MRRRLRRRRWGVIARALHATRVSNRVNMYRTKERGKEEKIRRRRLTIRVRFHSSAAFVISFFDPIKEEEKV